MIIGYGKVGAALLASLSRAGHDVRFAKKGEIAETASWAEVIIVAVPFRAVSDVVRAMETAADGKTVIDVTNALGPDFEWPWALQPAGPRSCSSSFAARMSSRLQHGLCPAHEHGQSE